MRYLFAYIIIMVCSCSPPCGYDVNSKVPYVLKGDFEVINCVSDGWGGYEMLI